MTDPQNEVLTLTLTPDDLLVVEYDKGEVCGNERMLFHVQNKRGGKFTHTDGEDLNPIITTYSPQLTIRQVVAETIAIMTYVSRWLQTCEKPYQETPEYDADLDVQEAKMERSAV